MGTAPSDGEAGVPTTLARYDGMIHNFHFNDGVDRAREAVDLIVAHLRAAFGLPAVEPIRPG